MNPRYYLKHMESLGLIGKNHETIRYALDHGCGKGADASYLESLGYTVTAIDEDVHYHKAVIMDIRDFPIEPEKYSVIICNNVLPFISEKSAVKNIIERIATGLKKNGVAFITLYGPNSGRSPDPTMSFYSFDEACALLRPLPLKIIDKTTTEGYSKNGKGEIIYQHSHRFILKKV